jgi:hypothetical protein
VRRSLNATLRLEDAAIAVCGKFEVNEVVSENLVNAGVDPFQRDSVPFTFDSEESAADRLRETVTSLVWGSGVASDGEDQGIGQSLDILSVGEAEGRLTRPELTGIAGNTLGRSSGIEEGVHLENLAAQIGLLFGGAALFVVAIDGKVSLNEVSPLAVGVATVKIFSDGKKFVATTLVLKLSDSVDDSRSCLGDVESGEDSTRALEKV